MGIIRDLIRIRRLMKRSAEQDREIAWLKAEIEKTNKSIERSLTQLAATEHKKCRSEMTEAEDEVNPGSYILKGDAVSAIWAAAHYKLDISKIPREYRLSNRNFYAYGRRSSRYEPENSKLKQNFLKTVKADYDYLQTEKDIPYLSEEAKHAILVRIEWVNE